MQFCDRFDGGGARFLEISTGFAWPAPCDGEPRSRRHRIHRDAGQQRHDVPSVQLLAGYTSIDHEMRLRA
jgi:hypothetical protein